MTSEKEPEVRRMDNTDRILNGLTFIEACNNREYDMMQDILDHISAIDLVLGITKASLAMSKVNENFSDGNLSASKSIQMARETVLYLISTGGNESALEEI